MIGTVSFEKSSINQRLDNYIIEKHAIEEKLKKPTTPREKRGRLEFRKMIIRRKTTQLVAMVQ